MALANTLSPRVVKVAAAAVAGLGVGTLVPPDPVRLPVAGSVPGLVVGAVLLAGGLALYVHGPSLLGTGDCGCGGGCGDRCSVES